MATTDRVEAAPKMSEAERQTRLDALFAKRDAAIARGEVEIWDLDRINAYLREQRGRGEDEALPLCLSELKHRQCRGN